MMLFNIGTCSLAYGYVSGIAQVYSPFYNARPAQIKPTLLVIHNISLPPQQYGGPYVEQLFTGTLNPEVHPYFLTIYQMEVSSHFFIRRTGEVVQFVSCDKRAWHAGKSSFHGHDNCNDYSIGIEMEGSDYDPFTAQQYQVLADLTKLLFQCYPLTDITGHADIAPERKTDPGPYFDWNYYYSLLEQSKTDD